MNLEYAWVLLLLPLPWLVYRWVPPRREMTPPLRSANDAAWIVAFGRLRVPGLASLPFGATWMMRVEPCAVAGAAEATVSAEAIIASATTITRRRRLGCRSLVAGRRGPRG